MAEVPTMNPEVKEPVADTMKVTTTNATGDKTEESVHTSTAAGLKTTGESEEEAEGEDLRPLVARSDRGCTATPLKAVSSANSR